MALFGRKKEEQTNAAGSAPAAQSARTGKSKAVPGHDYAHVLVRPRITEKATEQSMRGVYVFDVAPGANKKEIAAAVRRVYKVEPAKIRIVRTPDKIVQNPRTGVSGVKSGAKKAYVYLKEGDRISVM